MDEKRPGHLASLRDIAGEAVEAIAGRKARSLLTMIGVAFGILALVATVALTGTAAAQVSARFDALKATRVTVDGFTRPPESAVRDGFMPAAVPPDALSRTIGLNGVVSAGVVSATKDALPEVSRLSSRVPSAVVETPVMALTPGALSVFGVRPVTGRLFDSGHEDQRRRVVVLGAVAARDLGIDRVDGDTLVYIQGRGYLLLGIADTADFDSEAPMSAMVPDWVTRDPASGLSFGDPQVVIQTRPGAAQQVGAEARTALDPARPGRLAVQVPPDPRLLRAGVETDTRTLFLIMAGVSLLISAIGIGNTTLVSVIERRHEIGLRRAIGASRRNILAQFLLESGALGLAGGVLGTVAGLDLSIGIALYKDWTAAISPWLIVVGPALGATVGLLAGIQPAIRAARVEPVTALSS